MRRILTLKWCVFVGALMAASIWGTFYFKHVVQDPPGVYTRWYDGSTQRVDRFWPNGKLQSTTTYGDDGKTVMIRVDCNEDGVITHSKVRREDGKVVEKQYSDDGKSLEIQVLWSGDGTTLLAQSQWYPNGKLRSETIMTEDGAAPVSRRMFYPDGSPMMETHILPNADQVMNQYSAGKLIKRSTFHANTDRNEEFFFPGTEVVMRRTTRTALTGDFTTDYFNKNGELVYSSKIVGPGEGGTNNRFNTNGKGDDDSLPDASGKVENSVYSHGQLILRQTGVNFLVTTVEEFNPSAKTPRRKIELDEKGKVKAVYTYRPDGTLQRVKHIEGGAVAGTDEYDATGTKIIRSQPGGAPEQISPELLLPVHPPKQED